jgi:enediyne biosynthesis protein E4
MRFAAAFPALLSLLASELWAGPAWGQTAAPAAPAIRFVEAEAAAGIAHVHHKPVLDPKLAPIMPWMTAIGAAAAAGDFNNDGWIDLYLTDSQQGKPNRLYRNNGNGTFTDVAGAAGVAQLNDKDGVSTDCIWGDVDNDGWADLYVVRWGRDVLLHNNGDGTFRDVTRERFRRQDGSPGTDWKNGAGAIFFDYDLDGRLDLYVGNYFADFDLTRLETTRVMHDSFEAARNAGHNQLFHQEPDGSFRDVAPALGVDDTGWTLAVGAADVDNDGWPDLYVANDFGTDKLFLNRRDGTFKDVSVEALGVDTKKGMNVDFGDFNADGWLDIYVTNITTPRYVREGNMLWLNNGLGKDGKLTFTDVGAEAGVAMGGWAWGARFFDADNDGDLDLFCANGFISAGAGDYWPDIVAWRSKPHQPIDALSWPPIGDKSFSGFEPDRFWRNVDRSSFVEEAAAVGLASTRDGRGVVAFDYDNDGDLDLYVANQGQAGQLFRNETSHSGHWLELTLRGAPKAAANRDAVGARITVTLAGAKLIRERDGGNGYAGQSDPRVHFGLGDATAVPRLEILWPDGGVQEWTNVAADQDFIAQQDSARYVRPARTKPPQNKALPKAKK